ncbi:putative methyltransferase [Herbidospora galbida]|uniref:Putative methyltransferase n=2 Tax=Herbidospora galbida TaxID=2575442 RepID=A0A4U3MCD8_9ACTN|nr:putative methyltransferase [Herbidospora galbida]
MSIDELYARAGVDGWRLRKAVSLLSDGRWWTLADVVRETATSRRTIEALMRVLPLEHRDQHVRIPTEQVKLYNISISSSISDPVSHMVDAEVVARMAALIAGAPRGRSALDHVSATPETVVRRALLLGSRFWLPGSRLLCVGDHDLTSLAVRLIHPDVEVMVVDVDDRILAYIDEQDLGVTTRWADLRLGLPPSARGWADLAITDPPYTPDGVGLFVARGLEGLRDRDEGRVLLAYGASERTPMLALKVQHSLADLQLLNEAIYPDFNRYDGAEAIGSAADLYVLRPTTKSWPAVASRVDRLATAIYTQGPQAVESAKAAPPELGDYAPDLLVGDWPRDLLPGVPRVRLSTWLAKPYAAQVSRVAIHAPGLEAALPRLVLAARDAEVRVFGTASPVRLPPAPDAVTRRILATSHGKVANAWREGLVAELGLTKNQARARIPAWAGATALELPMHRLTGLAEAVARSLEGEDPGLDEA